MNLNKNQHKIYDCIISTLAIILFVLIILDIADDSAVWMNWLSNIILGVFVIDYLVRFVLAKNKWNFFTHNIGDLIAILPLYSLAQLLKVTKSASVLKLLKVPRMAALLFRPLRKARKFFNTNGFKYVVCITMFIIVIGGVLIHFAEGMSINDGIWWAFVTATTVGYGDISPSSFYGRLIAMVLMLVGIGLIGSLTSTLTSYFIHEDRKGVKEKTLEMIHDQIDNFENLSDEEIDDMAKILKALKKKTEHSN